MLRVFSDMDTLHEFSEWCVQVRISIEIRKLEKGHWQGKKKSLTGLEMGQNVYSIKAEGRNTGN